MSDTNTETNVAADRLRSCIERVEFVETEIKANQDGRTDIYAEARGEGYDVKVLKAIVRRRKQDRNEVAEHEAVMDLYLRELGEVA